MTRFEEPPLPPAAPGRAPRPPAGRQARHG